MDFETAMKDLDARRSVHRNAWGDRQSRLVRDPEGTLLIRNGDQWENYTITEEDRLATDWQPIRGWM